MKKVWYLLVAMLILGLLFVGCTTKFTVPGADVVEKSVDYTYYEEWDGRGKDSEDCSKVGQEGRTTDGWIHWVFNTKGDSTNAELVLGGSGSGTYAPGEPLTANIWHFYTPFFSLDELTAIIYLYGGAPGSGGGLVISDYCDGEIFKEEVLQVSKTVVPSYTREHFWKIDKKVETENSYEHDGKPKVWLYIDGSGDECATWTIDVTYDSYEDSNWGVSGTITILNNDDYPVTITDIVDTLCGEEIEIECGVTLPYNLPVGETLTCTYSESFEEKVTDCYNIVTVYTESGGEYESNSVNLIWGDPTTEIYKTVNIKDLSDLFGEVDLGIVTAPNNGQFTYTKDFAWENYGAELCGDYQYDNTATIVETKQSASATLLVNVQCYIYETAYAKGYDAICFIPTFRNWGWTNYVPTAGTGSWELWAAAGQCDTNKGTLVGSVTVNVEGCNVEYNVESPYTLEETHFYIGCTPFPTVKQGKKTVQTVAPGLYYTDCTCSGDKYVIAHAVVGIPDPNFGPQE